MMRNEKLFNPPFYLKNKHLQTILPALFRKIEITYTREVIKTPDDDFLVLDWVKNNANSVVVLFHGLEGSAHSQYIKGLAKVLSKFNYDVLCVNFRSCGGRVNKYLHSYHSGQTSDYEFIFNHLITTLNYSNIYAAGFSLGGNALLKYLGEQGKNTPIKKAVAVSVPVDLKASAETLSKGFNSIYLKRFLKRLKVKVRQKEKMFPDAIDYKKVYQANNFEEFDDVFTAPVHGFKNAEDYWLKCSSKQFLINIKQPSLIINALNDPFLTKKCYPYEECLKSDFVHLLTPKFGGHVGFPKLVEGLNFYEKTIVDFFEN